MRVALDVTPLVGHRTGIGLAVGEILQAFSKLEEPPDIVPYALSLRARRHRAELPAATRFLPVPARVLVRTWGATDWPRVDRWLADTSMLHATNYLAPPSRGPTLVSVYDCSFLRYPELCTPEVRRFAPAIRRAARRGAWVHTGSHFVADEIREAFGRELVDPSRVVVVPLGIPNFDVGGETPPPTPPVRPPFLLALGTLEPRKNLARLVRAFGVVAADRPDLRLVLAGSDGPGRAAVDTARASLASAIAARVELLGTVSDATRSALLQHATALAYPSLYEGFGFPVLEAMAAGVPVVAARAGSIPEIAGSAAVLVDADDVDSIADGLAEVLDDESRRAELVRRGRGQAERFRWSATAQGLVDLYERLTR